MEELVTPIAGGLLISYLLFILALLGLNIHGLIISFKSNTLLGILTFFLQPLPIIISLVKLVGKINLADKIIKAIK